MQGVDYLAGKTVAGAIPEEAKAAYCGLSCG